MAWEGDCTNCEGERLAMCNELFYEAAVRREGDAAVVEILENLGAGHTARMYGEDVDGETTPKLKRRLQVIGCAFNDADVEIALRERVERLDTDGR